LVEVVFRNVGQGDSIILKWVENGNSSYAIIDCNLFKGQNSVLEYVKHENVKEIDFMILSHPHEDHFSGFLQLLSFCNSNSIKIRRFLHTALIHPTYLRACSKSREADGNLF